MRSSKIVSVFTFISGFVLGNFIGVLFPFDTVGISLNLSEPSKDVDLSADGLYNEKVSQKLFHEVKILCWVFTHPDNHYNKSMYIKNLWGKRCNKLLFMSHEEDPLLGTVKLPVGEGRGQLWNKTIATYFYVRNFQEKLMFTQLSLEL